VIELVDRQVGVRGSICAPWRAFRYRRASIRTGQQILDAVRTTPFLHLLVDESHQAPAEVLQAAW
jgi:hypothetical protein